MTRTKRIEHKFKILILFLMPILFAFNNCGEENLSSDEYTDTLCAEGSDPADCDPNNPPDEEPTVCPAPPSKMIAGTKQWTNPQGTTENSSAYDDGAISGYLLPSQGPGLYLKGITKNDRYVKGILGAVHVASAYTANVRVWISKCPGGPRITSPFDVMNPNTNKMTYRCDEKGETPQLLWTVLTKEQAIAKGLNSACLLQPNTTYYANITNPTCGQSVCPTRVKPMSVMAVE